MRKRHRAAIAAGALIVGAAVVAVNLPAATASNPAAAAPRPGVDDTHRAPSSGALPAALTPAQQHTLISQATARRAATATSLRLGAKEKLVVKSVARDRDGSTHTRYERTYAGLPVLGGDLVVHQNPAGDTTGVDKATTASIAVATTTPSRSAASAKSTALSVAKAKGTKKPSVNAPREVIWANGGKPALAWESVVGGVQDDGTPSRLHVVTDAATGKPLYRYQAIDTGVGNSEYSGPVNLTTSHRPDGSYDLTDPARGNHRTYTYDHGDALTLLTDSDDVWGDGNGATAQTAGVDAAYGAQETWDFYKNTLGRSGIKNDGVGATSRTHFGDHYNNAFWDDDCFCMTYGDGNDDISPLTELDVAGHEMSHGVTANTAGLQYTGESGGLNEATSDIFGTGVEFYANIPADPGDYLIGEKLDLNDNGTPLRYMDRPSKDGASSDYWSSSLGGLDVHYSSGPANHLFYLLSEGSGAKTLNGVDYDSPTINGRTVPGIGRDNALMLWYKALTEHFTSTTDYAAARQGTLEAAAELWGTDTDTYRAVGDAWAGIGVGKPLSGARVESPGDQVSLAETAVHLQLRASSTNAGPLDYSVPRLPPGLKIDASSGVISGTPTIAGTYPVAVTVKDSANTTDLVRFTWTVHPAGSGCSVGQLSRNPGFESGVTGWTQSPGVIDKSAERAARTGLYKAWFDGYGRPHTDTLSQSVSIPASCNVATLTFYLSVTSDEPSKTAVHDDLAVSVDGTILADWSNLDRTTGYVKQTVDLSAYHGKAVTLTFTGTEDSTTRTTFLVDDTVISGS